jgi:uncharacterized damage-inducible protein DinB
MATDKIQSISRRFATVLQGQPWYGTAVYTTLQQVNPEKVYKKTGASPHSIIDILYHMITWTEFAVNRVEKERVNDLSYSEKMDWRDIDPAIHTWENAMTDFKALNDRLLQLLQTKEDAFLNETVDYRNYNFKVLLLGLADHHIYHIGQIALLKNHVL